MAITDPGAGGKILNGWTGDVTDQLNVMGIVGSGLSSTSNGTASSGSSKARDAVLGNLQVTLKSKYLYEIRYTGGMVNTDTANVRAGHWIYYVAGTGTPTTSDTLGAHVGTHVQETGTGGRVTLGIAQPFTVGSDGSYTFALFTGADGVDSASITPIPSDQGRHLYILCIGQP